MDAAGLDRGTRDKLDTQLQAALAYFNAGETADGVSRLEAFVSDVRAQSGKKIGLDLADAWIADAQRIITAGINCGFGAETLSEQQPLGTEIDCNHPGAHRDCELSS